MRAASSARTAQTASSRTCSASRPRPVEKAPATERRNLTLLKERVRVDLKRYIQKQTGARPVIVPVVVQV
jgi:mRNA degradation ribonuclease J1/J2